MGFELKNVGAGIIGYGGAFNMGRQHGQQIEKAGMKVVAACDIDPARAKAAAQDFPGIQTTTDYRELIANPKVDLCVVILPHNLHAPVTLDCLEAGKHVVVEKPMCVTTEEADAMIQAARSRNLMLSIYHNRRWDGDYLTIKEVVEKGLIGEVFHIECAIGGFHRPSDWWRSDKALAGSGMHDWGAHFFDWILHLIPSPVQSVTGNFLKRRWHEHTIEDHTHALVRFENGATADLQVSMLNASRKPMWRVLGTQGGLTSDWGKPVTVHVDHDGYLASFELPPKKVEMAYYENIAGHLMHGEELFVKPEESRRTIAIVEAAERSSGQGGVAVAPN
ncbi:MAG TPA: Gfo/Idh/MocA family oxidoreductase [Fimbriimonadaceae bacterium]|nr:Gfo/Idh/MocA family oxidoreductase [Fimbriimonadaceae bacterium]